MQYSEPAHYIISVAGKIHPDVLNILSNFFSGSFEYKIQNSNSCLEGLIKDQAALSGILNYLSDLHYVLLSVSAKEELNEV